MANYGTREVRVTGAEEWLAATEATEAARLAEICGTEPWALVGIGAVSGLIPGSILGALIGLLAGDAGKGALVGMGLGFLAGGGGMYAMHRVGTRDCP